MPLYPPFWRPFKQNGWYFQRNMTIWETKRRIVSILTLCLCFVGRGFHRKYCRIHHAIMLIWIHYTTATNSHLQHVSHEQTWRDCPKSGRPRKVKVKIMPLHPLFWKPFRKHGGHVQSNTSISETKRRRAFNFDSMSRFCWAYTCRKSIVSYVSVPGINRFDVYGGHFIKWWPFPWIMLFISATKRDVITIMIYSCIF